MIADADNEFARWNKLFMQVRGRGASRDEFRNAAVGKTWLQAVEILSDDPEADAALNAQNVGQVAVRDDWQGQIKTLLAQKDALAAELAKPEVPADVAPAEPVVPEPAVVPVPVQSIALTMLPQPRTVYAPNGAIVIDLLTEKHVGRITSTRSFEVVAYTNIGGQFYFLNRKMADAFPTSSVGIPNQQLREVISRQPVLNDTVIPQAPEERPVEPTPATVSMDMLGNAGKVVAKTLHALHGEWNHVLTKKGKQ